MSEQGSSGEAPGGAAADAVATRARQRHARDKGLVEAARGGDRAAFGKLYDEWVDSVYDRAIHAGASAAEAREITEQTFLTAWRDVAKLKQPAAFGAKVMQVARRETLARVSGGEKIVPKSGPSAEERLTRATSAADTASDPEAAAVLREAAHALDEQTRDILDLHFRLGLTRNEVAAVLGEQPDKVAQTITKLPPALAVLTRARVLWRGGAPEDDGLQEALAAENVVAFNASAVRTINRYAKDNDRARARSLMGIPPVELFAAIPLADAPAGLKTAVASRLVTESVPMDGSAYVKRDDKGAIVDAPKAPPPPDGSIRPGIENKRPTIDPKKAAVAAAAALAAERAADDETAAALAADAAPAKSRRDRKADKNAEAAKVASDAADAKAADENLAGAADLEARKTDEGGSTATKVAGAAAAGAVVGVAGAAAAGAATDGPEVADPTAATTFPDADADTGADTDAGADTAGVPVAGGDTVDEPTAVVDTAEEPTAVIDTADERTDAPDDATSTAAAKDDNAWGGSSSRTGAKTAAAAGAGLAAGTAAGATAAGATGAANSGAGGTATSAATKAGGAGPRAGEQHLDGDGTGGGAGKWIAIGVAAALLLGLVVFVATRGGDDGQQVATEGNPTTTKAVTTSSAPGTTKATTTSSTATTAPTATTEPTETTVAPTETTTPTTRAGGNPTTPTNPAPTDAPTTTVPLVKVDFGISPNNAKNKYDPNAPDSPKLSWSVNGEATVTVEGPNFSSSLPNASNQSVCPVAPTAGLCELKGVTFPQDFAYRITVRQTGAPQQVYQVVLQVRAD